MHPSIVPARIFYWFVIDMGINGISNTREGGIHRVIYDCEQTDFIV